ncbi:polysaccharide biosynthesis tyrosine autokinase [Gordonia amicalis]|uniref:polysaccharide biosynthesis tyrosine autokinase n=1 Tax=Gordonia amicalis TaxID=89053 RepID=UPI00387DBF5A
MTMQQDLPTGLEDPSRHRTRRFGLVARRDWWIAVLTSLLFGVLALGYSTIATPIYKATAVLYVTSSTDSNSQSAYQGSLASQQRVASYAQLVRSDVIVGEAVAANALGISVEEAQTTLSASSAPGTVLLNVSAKSDDPATAAGLANGVAEAMTRYVQTLETPSGGGSPLAKLTVVTPAQPASTPTSPNYIKNVLGGLLVGLVFGLLFVLLRNKFDSKVRSETDIEELLGSPPLAAIPDDTQVSGHRLIDFRMGAGPAAEAYRKLRANLAFVRVDSPPRVIVISSPQEGEGKSTTSANLASALAESGHSVVIVDGDLRRPTVASTFEVTNAVGFTNYLTRELDLENIIQQSKIRGVDVIASGPKPPNPAELLESKRAREAIDELRCTYDYVVIDAPPILPLADPVVLGRAADALLLVVCTNRTRNAESRAAVEELSTAGVELLGVILNRAQVSAASYGKYSYYRIDEDGRSTLGSDVEAKL